jgi:hypothetical protein
MIGEIVEAEEAEEVTGEEAETGGEEDVEVLEVSGEDQLPRYLSNLIVCPASSSLVDSKTPS